jgi:hypothetical protein
MTVSPLTSPHREGHLRLRTRELGDRFHQVIYEVRTLDFVVAVRATDLVVLDVDLSVSDDSQPRKYPAPPTGHDLMAMFPAAPPDNFPELRAGPTSGFFSRQERQFFAQAGKEIVRVRVDEIPHGSSGAWPPPPTASHAASARSASSASQSPNMSSSTAPVLYPHPPRARNGASNASPLFPLSTNHPHHPHSGPPANLHATISLNQSSPERYTHEKGHFAPEDFDDEAWRQPMPPSERRRAGKHTRRVIVKT